MDGVVVLNTIEGVYCGGWVFIFSMIGIIIGIILMGKLIDITIKWAAWASIPLLLTVFVICIAIGIFIGYGIEEKETHYEVTIDDSVSMSEFNEKYEIIEQRGEIYTVKERE